MKAFIRSSAARLRRSARRVGDKARSIALTVTLIVAANAGAQPPDSQNAMPPRPPAPSAHDCPGARQPALGPLNPQGQPWEREEADGGLGYCDTPVIPGQKWRVHDVTRPAPRVITPGTASTQETIGKPPSDAVVLLDGTQATYLDHWVNNPRAGRGGRGGVPGAGGPPGAGGAPMAGRGAPESATAQPSAPQDPTPRWKFENGYITPVQGTADIRSKETFSGPLQIHVEWASNPLVVSKGQFRSNSGVFIMGVYEMQVLDTYQNETYADGGAGAIYGQFPPLVNASRKPGEWQTYDFIWEPPDFDHLKPAFVTIIHNGVVVQNHQQLLGNPLHRSNPRYTPHGPEGPILLQNHGERVAPFFRSIWVRRLGNVDEQ